MPSHAVGLPGNRQHRMVIGFGVFRVVIRICPEAQHAPEAPARPLGRSELFCINVASLACPTPSSHRQLLRRPPPRLRTSPRSRADGVPACAKNGRPLRPRIAGRAATRRLPSRPIRAFSATPHDGQRPCRTLAEDPGRTGPELRIPGAAAQTRVVSMAAIRLGSWESARAFKGIICDDISEFESHMPSHAVQSPPAQMWRSGSMPSCPASGRPSANRIVRRSPCARRR